MDTRPYERYIGLDRLTPLWAPSTSWTYESQARAMLGALELNFLLIRDALDDRRPYVLPYARVERLLMFVHEQLLLITQLLPPVPAECAIDAPAELSNLRWCVSADAPLRARIDAATALWLAQLSVGGWHLGIEPQINQLRSDCGLVPLPLAWGKPALPYDAWAAPAQLLALVAEHTFNAEDALFAGVHQMDECWLHVANTRSQLAVELAHAGSWTRATQLLHETAQVLRFLNRQIEVLDTMVLADYHPLRVQLRDASGAQSAQVMELARRFHRLLPPLQQQLQAQRCAILDVYAEPQRFIAEHHYLEAITTMEMALSSFFFHHYKLAARVLGTESLGSLGFELQKLISRFTAPLSPAMDQARYDHVVVTNFAYNAVAGAMTSDLERAYAEDTWPATSAPAAPPAALVHARIEAYFDALSRQAIDEWAALFTSDAQIEDPEGSRPFRGPAGLRIYFKGFMKVLGKGLEIDVAPPQYDERTGVAQVRWTLRALYRSIPLETTDTAVLHFDDEGLIRQVTVHQDHTTLAEILRAEIRRAETEVIAPAGRAAALGAQRS